MADDAEIVVEIEKDDGAVAAKTETTTAADPLADLKAQHAELEADRERERQGREAAQRQAESERQARLAAEQERDAGRTEITETRLGTVEQGLSAAQTASDAAKAEYKTAMEAGDWDKAAEAQVKIADARADLKRLLEAKSDLEAQKSSSPPLSAPSRQEATRASSPADPVEAFIASRTEPTARWLREHKDFITDPRKNAKMTGAHWDAIGEGLQTDTPEYFAHVEKYLGLTKAAPNGKGNGNGNGSQPPARRSASSAPVAPVQASAGGTSGGKEVRLTPGEAKTATDGTLVWNTDSKDGRYKKGDPIGIQEFARRKSLMMEQGLYDKTYVEQ